MIGSMRVVDLTQPLDPDTVMWPGAPAHGGDRSLTIADDGFYNRLITFAEHTGTHFDAPCHMVEGAADAWTRSTRRGSSRRSPSSTSARTSATTRTAS